MRTIAVLMMTGALLLAGCGSSNAEGTGGDSGANGEGGAGGMMDNGTPAITMVAWAPIEPCAFGTPGEYTVTVTAEDPEGDPLTYRGSVAGCDGQLDDATSTIECPNAAPYRGMVVIEDDAGNVSVPVDFTVDVCETASVEP